MKTQLYRRAALGLTLALSPLVGGCNAGEDGSIPGLITTALAEPAAQSVAATNATPVSPETGASVPPAETPAAPTPAGELALPPSIKPSSPLAEIVKLAQSGVAEGVMLTYITNSSSTFGLGADEIVYLNDLGLPSEVITSIMEHDKAMKQFWADQAQTQQAAATAPEAAPAEQTAMAPSYENPPPAEPIPAEPQPANVTYNYFYDTLSPYGSWVNVDGYGMCWQPSTVVVNRGWQPYRDGGRWMYTDAGWYWYSDYTWGWAPFHYGRWFSHPSYGWCWNPGYAWGPSWVSWRYNDGYCGWAPLPPEAHYSAGFGFSYYGSSVGVSFGFGLGYDCYTFVPWNRFCNYRPSRYYAPKHHSKEIYNNSTVVNNIINGNNNTIINNGVPIERVTAATKTDIQKVAIRDMAGASGRGARRERLEGDGRTLAVHRPQSPQNSFAPTGSAGSELRQGRQVTAGRPADSQISQPASRSGRTLEPRPIQNEEPAPGSGRTAFAGENPVTPTARTTQPRTAATTRNAPTTTASTPAPTPKPIDVPSTRSVAGPTRTGSENSAAGRSTVPPLIVRGSDRVSEPVARPVLQANAPSRAERTPTPSSLVVIGKRDNTPSQRQGTITIPQPTPAETARPEPQSPPVSAASERQSYSRPAAPQRQFSQPQNPTPSVSRNSSPVAPQPIQRQESPRPSRNIEVQTAPRPSYSAPVQRSSAPAPSFTPRPSSPSPAPQISRPAPSPAPAARPQPSPPAVSAPRSAPPPASRPQPSAPSAGSRPGSRNN